MTKNTGGSPMEADTNVLNRSDRSTSLDPIETSVSIDPPDDYQSYRTIKSPKEWTAACELYDSLYNSIGTGRLWQLQRCRTMAWFIRSKIDHSVRVASNACRLRWCPLCGDVRRSFIRSQALTWLESSRSAKFLTLTLRHSKAPLEYQIKVLYSSFRKLRLRKGFTRNVHGGLWMFEIKRSKKDGLWHPHLHCLIDADYIPQHRISTMWANITHGSPIVHIEAVSDPSKAAAYLSKYATKPAVLSQYTVEDRIVIYNCLHGKRLCGTWGTLKQIKLTQPPRDDRDDWVQLDTWHDVISTIDTNPRSAAIWKAYRDNEKLDDNMLSSSVLKYINSSKALDMLEKYGLDPPVSNLEV